MAQLVVAVAGAAIGGALAPGIVALGMTGASMGWMAGSMIGGAMFAPTQKSQGPKLGDLAVGGSSYGAPIPWIAGSPRISGQVAWASAKREIASVTRSGGKGGGGGSEYTSYTYEVDLLILLTDNEIDGVRRIWANGEVIWSAVASAGVGSLAASATTPAWSRLTVYTGAASQLPDPTYEAAVGTANAPAYRGRGSVFIQSYQLGSSGQIPNLTFEVVADGTITTSNVGDGLLCHFDAMNGEKVQSQLGPDLTAGGALQSGTVKFGAKAGSAGGFSCTTATGALDPAKHWRAEGWFYISTNYTGLFTLSNAAGTRYVSLQFNGGFGTDSYYFSVLVNGGGASGVAGYMSTVFTRNAWNHVALQFTSPNKINLYSNGRKARDLFVGDFTVGGVPETFSHITISGNICDEFYFRFINTSDLYPDVVAPGVAYTVPGGPFDSGNLQLYAIEQNTVSVQSVVSAITERTGILTGKYDATALSTITRPVRGLANSSVSTARTLLEMLASTYNFEAVLSDKIYFRPRGGAAVATITFDELGVMHDSTKPPDPLPLTQANELEIPAQMALTYNSMDGDYQTDTQYSDRLLTGMESTSTLQVPLGFTSTEAKQIADTLLMDKAVSALSTRITLDTSRAALQPTDVIQVIGEDSSSYRMRVTRRTDTQGITTLQCVADDASVLIQSGVTSGGTDSQTVVAPVATTSMLLLDLPALRDAEDQPGLYVAVTGSAANWTGAAIYDSLDNITYNVQATFSTQAPLGFCTTTLGAWTGGNTFDETNTVTVNVGIQQLASVTWSDLLASTEINAALVGSELIQYRVATLVSSGIYTLSGLLRGRKGTASTGHAAAERFVALSVSSGLQFLPLQSGDLARLRYYKGVSASQALSAVTAQTITPIGNTLKPLQPVDARANRNATDTVLTWVRQTRLSTRIVGTLPMSIPLGEATESYEVEVWDSGYTTLKRTMTASTPIVTYTNAQQVTDFGSAQATVYLKIYQLSATVGRGTALTVSV